VKVEILLFGPGAAAVGRDRLTVDVPDDQPTCGQVRAALCKGDPILKRLVPRCRLAVNHCFAAEEQRVSERDELALIGLVSGG